MRVDSPSKILQVMRMRSLAVRVLFMMVTACGGGATEPLRDGGTDADLDADLPDAHSPGPSIYFVDPPGDVFAASTPIALRAVATTVVDRIDILVDGVLVANLDAPYEYRLPTANLSVGPHTVLPRGVSNGRFVDGTPFVLHVDRTPIPTLTQADIDFGQGLMPGEYTPIVVTFGEAPVPGTVSSLGVVVHRVYGNTHGYVTGTLTMDGAVVTFTPSNPWVEAAEYAITIEGTATDLAGNETVLDISSSRTVLTY